MDMARATPQPVPVHATPIPLRGSGSAPTALSVMSAMVGILAYSPAPLSMEYHVMDMARALRGRV